MKAIDYQNKKKCGVWVPEAGSVVEFREFKGWTDESHKTPILSEKFSNGHTVQSLFISLEGDMMAFINGRRGHVPIECLTKANSQTGPRI